jgi:hypothetical protein
VSSLRRIHSLGPDFVPHLIIIRRRSITRKRRGARIILDPRPSCICPHPSTVTHPPSSTHHQSIRLNRAAEDVDQPVETWISRR